MTRKVIQALLDEAGRFVVITDDGLLFSLNRHGDEWLPYGVPIPQPADDYDESEPQQSGRLPGVVELF